jgi:23S rRNA pseudouridine1911/1915/1917 synthase
VIRFAAEASHEGERVDVVLARTAHVTRVRAQRALRAGDVLVDGETVRPSHRLEAGQVVEGEVPPSELGPPEAEDIPIEVRYEDKRVLVIEKPAGLVVHPARGHTEGTLVNALLGLGVPLAGEGSVRPGIVHRLDKDTSGLLLVARDDDAQKRLVEALRDRRIERRYLALVRGAMPAASGTIDAPVGRHPVKRRSMAVVEGGRRAVTHYRVLASTAWASLLDVKLETGRTHQIRVHLAHLGHPVLGDRTYGGVAEGGPGRPWLHAFRVVFPHPDDGRRIEVTAAPPDDLMAWLAQAGLSVPPDLF